MASSRLIDSFVRLWRRRNLRTSPRLSEAMVGVLPSSRSSSLCQPTPSGVEVRYVARTSSYDPVSNRRSIAARRRSPSTRPRQGSERRTRSVRAARVLHDFPRQTSLPGSDLSQQSFVTECVEDPRRVHDGQRPEDESRRGSGVGETRLLSDGYATSHPLPRPTADRRIEHRWS